MFGFGTGGHYNVGSCLETSEFRLSSPRKQSCEGKKKDSSSLVILKCYFTQIWKSCHNLLTRSHKTISQWNRNNNSFSILSSSYYQHACEHIKYCKHKLNDTSVTWEQSSLILANAYECVSHENKPHRFSGLWQVRFSFSSSYCICYIYCISICIRIKVFVFNSCGRYVLLFQCIFEIENVGCLDFQWMDKIMFKYLDVCSNDEWKSFWNDILILGWTGLLRT